MGQLKYYNEALSAWEPVIVGAAGPTGPQGETGPAGPTGPNADQSLNTTDSVTFASLNIVPQSEEDNVDLGGTSIVNAAAVETNSVAFGPQQFALNTTIYSSVSEKNGLGIDLRLTSGFDTDSDVSGDIVLSIDGGAADKGTIQLLGDVSFNAAGTITNDGEDNLQIASSNRVNLQAGSVVNIAADASEWQFDTDGTLILPAGGNITFPDNSQQNTAFLTDDVEQTGYQFEIDTDIYNNTNGGAVVSTETAVDLGSPDIVRQIFNIQPTATSTDTTVTQVGPDWVLTVNTLTGAPLDGTESVWLAGGNLIASLVTSTQTGPNSWIIFPYAGLEITAGTEFEFYPSGWTNYTPSQTVTIEWDSGETTEVLYGQQNNPYSSAISLVTAEDQRSLQYPIVVTTADYEASSHSIVVDDNNGFKLTSKANDFIIDAGNKPVVIRSGNTDVIIENGNISVGDLTISDSRIDAVNGSLIIDSTNSLDIVTNAVPVKLQINDELGEPDQTWLFGIDGALSKAGSDGLTLAANYSVKIVADYTDNDRTWTFNGGDSSLTFPDGSVQSTAWTGTVSYNDLTDTPTVLTSVSQITNLPSGNGALSVSTVGSAIAVEYTPADVPTNISDLTNDANYVASDTTGITGADRVTNMVTLTQAEYDAIGTPDAATVYFIVG